MGCRSMGAWLVIIGDLILISLDRHSGADWEEERGEGGNDNESVMQGHKSGQPQSEAN